MVASIRASLPLSYVLPSKPPPPLLDLIVWVGPRQERKNKIQQQQHAASIEPGEHPGTFNDRYKASTGTNNVAKGIW